MISNGTPTLVATTVEEKKNILDFFYDEKPDTHTEVDEVGNETIIEDGTTKTLNWYKVGATSTGLAAFIGLLIWLIKRRH